MMLTCDMHRNIIRKRPFYFLSIPWIVFILCRADDCYNAALYSPLWQQTFWFVLVAGVTTNINSGSVLFKCPSDLSEHEHTRIPTLKQLNGMQPSLISLFTPVPFLLWHVKMLSVKKTKVHLLRHTVMLPLWSHLSQPVVSKPLSI